METQSTDPLQITCSSTTRAEGEVVVRIQIENVSDALDIRLEYIEAVHNYNQSIIDLELIINKGQDN